MNMRFFSLAFVMMILILGADISITEAQGVKLLRAPAQRDQNPQNPGTFSPTRPNIPVYHHTETPLPIKLEQQRDDYYADSIIFTDPYWPSSMRKEPYYQAQIRTRLKKKENEPYFNAVVEGDLAALQELYAQNYDNQTIQTNGEWMLRIAAFTGHVHIADYLLHEGVDIRAPVPEDNATGSEGFTPLIFAAQQGRLEMVLYLIQKGAGVNSISSLGITPLHLAARNNHFKTVEALLKLGADVNAKDDYGVTPLHLSAHGGSPLVTEMLIRAKADVNVQNEDGNSPLHFAAMTYELYDAKILILSGADVNLRNSKGQTPLDVVGDEWLDGMAEGWKSSRESMIKLLQHYGGN